MFLDLDFLMYLAGQCSLYLDSDFLMFFYLDYISSKFLFRFLFRSTNTKRSSNFWVRKVFRFCCYKFVDLGILDMFLGIKWNSKLINLLITKIAVNPVLSVLFFDQFKLGDSNLQLRFLVTSTVANLIKHSTIVMYNSTRHND